MSRKSHCENCNDITPHESLGAMPSLIVDDEPKEKVWYRCNGCTECGSVKRKNVREGKVESREKRYIRFLKRNDLIPEDEADEILED